jgi:putative membrane protein
MMWNGFNGGWGGFGGYGGWWFMPIIMIVVIGLVIWGIVTLSRRSGWVSGGGCCGSSYSGPESALDILKRRYASGEINKEEFEEKKKALS